MFKSKNDVDQKKLILNKYGMKMKIQWVVCSVLVVISGIFIYQAMHKKEGPCTT